VNVKVEVIELAPCKKQLRFELPAEDVDVAFAEVTRTYRKQANLPGYRKGKAPEAKVAAQFAKQIEERVREQLLSDCYRKGLEENKVRPILQPEVEEVTFEKGTPMKFLVHVETAPDFELPEYKGLPAKKPKLEVSDADVENALDKLREGRAEYQEQQRAVRAGDYVVLSYTGSSDGKPLTEFSPTARGMTKQENFPLHVHDDDHDHFIPGFTRQLIGANPGDERVVNVTIPDEFPSQPKLQGLEVVYEVKVQQVKEKVLPELSDDFAKTWEAENVEKLREGVANDLKANQEGEAMRVVRAQVHEELLKKVSFDVPEPVQQNELRIVVESMVRSRRAAGASEEDIEAAKEQITAEANPIAMDRSRWFFIHPLIAEAEKLEVSREEVLRVIAMQAQQMGKDPQQHVKELADNNQISAIQNQIREQKVVEFIAEHAEIEMVDPPEPEPAEHDHDHSHG